MASGSGFFFAHKFLLLIQLIGWRDYSTFLFLFGSDLVVCVFLKKCIYSIVLPSFDDVYSAPSFMYLCIFYFLWGQLWCHLFNFWFWSFVSPFPSLPFLFPSLPFPLLPPSLVMLATYLSFSLMIWKTPPSPYLYRIFHCHVIYRVTLHRDLPSGSTTHKAGVWSGSQGRALRRNPCNSPTAGRREKCFQCRS